MLKTTVDAAVDTVAPAVVSSVESAIDSSKGIFNITVADVISETLSSAVRGLLENAIVESVLECLEFVAAYSQ